MNCDLNFELYENYEVNVHDKIVLELRSWAVTQVK